MTSHYGRINLEAEMPSESLQRQWEREAKRQYDPHIHRGDLERYMTDYIWNKIADWQEDRRGR